MRRYIAPRLLGLAEIPQVMADALRATLLEPLRVHLSAPAGVTLCLSGKEYFLYNFQPRPVSVRLNGKRIEVVGLFPALMKPTSGPAERPARDP